MPASPDDLFAFLDELKIAHDTREHEPTFTVAQGRALKASMPGGHTKNLFLKDKDGALVLVSAWSESELKLNRLHRELGTRRLSFGDPILMYEALGVQPGSVTAFSLMNDKSGKVRFVLDQALAEFEQVNFHPLINTATTGIETPNLFRFVEATGRTVEIVDFKTLV